MAFGTLTPAPNWPDPLLQTGGLCLLGLWAIGPGLGQPALKSHSRGWALLGRPCAAGTRGARLRAPRPGSYPGVYGPLA